MQETDLKETKEQTLERISSLKDLSTIQAEQVEELRTQNVHLKASIKRYIKLIKEVEATNMFKMNQNSSHMFSINQSSP